MTRNDLEQVLADHGYTRKYHGTHSELWQKERVIVNLSDKGVEIGEGDRMISRRLPYELISVKDDKLIIHREVAL